MLSETKKLCFSFLEDDESFLAYSDSEIVTLYEFTFLKMAYIDTLKRSLLIAEDNTIPFTELNDTLTLKDELNDLAGPVDEVLYIKLAKDLNYVLTQLEFCYSIVGSIVRMRNIFKD